MVKATPTLTLPHQGGGENLLAFQQLQYQFTAHLRDPAQHPAPAGVEDRRMGIYRELLYNNIEGFLSKGFPVLRSLYADDGWHALARDFFARHISHTPLFYRIAEEFLAYLQHERAAAPADPPFLLELAHYEWVEVAVGIDPAPLPACNPDGDLLEQTPVLSPLARHLAYRYPVHKIRAEFQPAEAPAQPTYLVVVRDGEDKVGFVEINAVTSRLLKLIEQQPGHSGRQQLQTLADELQHPDPDSLLVHGRAMLEQLRSQSILLGTAL
ncbi:MAG: HvfC family RiPP maturation protein [Nevskiales bacterium]